MYNILCNKNIGHHACKREKEHLFRYRAYFEGNLLRFVRARAHVRALITRISCAVRMRNAKLRNHLNVVSKRDASLTLISQLSFLKAYQRSHKQGTTSYLNVMRAQSSNLYPVIGQYHHHLPLIERTFHLAGLNSPPNDTAHYTSIHWWYTITCCSCRHVYVRSSITALGAGDPCILTISGRWPLSSLSRAHPLPTGPGTWLLVSAVFQTAVW